MGKGIYTVNVGWNQWDHSFKESIVFQHTSILQLPFNGYSNLFLLNLSMFHGNLLSDPIQSKILFHIYFLFTWTNGDLVVSSSKLLWFVPAYHIIDWTGLYTIRREKEDYQDSISSYSFMCQSSMATFTHWGGY